MSAPLIPRANPDCVSVNEALGMDFGPDIDGRILQAQGLVSEIGVYSRQATSTARADVKAKAITLAKQRLHLLRGLIALDPWIEIRNLDLLERQLGEMEIG